MLTTKLKVSTEFFGLNNTIEEQESDSTKYYVVESLKEER